MLGGSIRRSLLVFGRRCSSIGTVAILLFCSTASFAAPITTGNLVLVRVSGGPNGDGSAALLGGGGANKVFLEEYTTGGVFVQSIPMPSTLSATVGGQRALTLSGTQNGEGHLTLSLDGQYLIMAGYNQTELLTGTNAAVATTTERVIGRVDMNGNVDTSTALVDAVSQQSVRSAYSTNGTDFWVTGNGGNNVTVNAVPNILTSGIHYAQFGVNTGGNTLSTQLNTTGLTANNRMVLSFGGSLFANSGNTSSPDATRRGVNVVSPGSIATTTGQIVKSLPGFPTAAGPAPDDFWFSDANTVFLADQRTNGIDGGIQKWAFDGTNWNLQYTLGAGAGVLTTISGGNAGVHGLTGRINGTGQAVLFGTTFDGTGGNQSKFFTITDGGAASPVTYLGTSAANSAFRGIEIVLVAPTPEPASISLLLIGMLAAVANRRRR